MNQQQQLIKLKADFKQARIENKQLKAALIKLYRDYVLCNKALNLKNK